MSNPTNITYKDAGVDTEKGQNFVKNIKDKVQSTHDKNVLGGLGGFAACYDVSFLKDYNQPILLSGTDGVGTKLQLAKLLNKHDTVGIDLVAMCANDILVNGGKPLFFQDYIACGKLDLQKMEQIVTGIVKGCEFAGCSLVGGETAEHPGVMPDEEYDLAGFVVGVVEKEKMIDGSSIVPGDVVLGLHSSGPHSNGFSLLRKLLLPNGKLPTDSESLTFLEEKVFVPTKIYVKSVLRVLEKFKIKGMVHITGGGFYENIPRVLPKGIGVNIDTLPKSDVFDTLISRFNLSLIDMYSTFNMGIGLVVIVEPNQADQVIEAFQNEGESISVLGVTTNDSKIIVKGLEKD